MSGRFSLAALMAPPPEGAPRLLDVLSLAWLLGLVAGVLEPLLLATRLSAASEGRMMLGAHLLWMPAAAELLLFSLAGVLGWGLARLLPGLVSRTVLLGAFVALALIASFRNFDGLVGVWTVNLVSVGLGVRIAQSAGGALPRALPRIRRLVAAGAVGLVAIATSLVVRERWAERAALAALPPAAGRPNVLILVLDTVRAMSLSVYGYERRTTPALERLAARGVVYERASSTAPWTRPSHASLFTGRFEHELTADHLVPLDATYPTLAEELARLGYRSGGFVANLTHAVPAAGIARGFTSFEAHRLSLPQVIVSAKVPGQLYKSLPSLGVLPEARINYVRKTAADINRSLLAWVDQDRARPFLAFANYMDAHDPYRPQPPFDTLFSSPAYPPMLPTRAGGPGLDEPREMRPYDQAIAYLDHEIDNLLGALEARGLLDSTIVIITSDHGEAFGEHGVYGHGSTLYLDMLQVPLLLAGPTVPAGLRVPAWVSLQAVAPTVMALVAPGAPQPFPGQPLTRFWRQDSARAEPVLAGSRFAANNPPWYPTSKGTISGLIDRDLMYIREADGRHELFDLQADPGQRANLAPTDARTAAFGAALTARVGPPVPHPRAPDAP